MEVTAVEWFAQITKELGYVSEHQLEQAKQMEKRQIIEFGSKMQIIKDVDFDGNVTFIYDPEKHFNENYGKQD